MKAIVVVLVAAVLLVAANSFAGVMGSRPMATPASGGGGLAGTVKDVGARGFLLSVTRGETEKVFKVMMDKSTQVTVNGQPGSADAIVTGAAVSIVGAQSGADVIQAKLIRVTVAATKKPK